MAVVNANATLRQGSNHVYGLDGALDTKFLTATVETTAGDSATSTYSFGYLPSNARILGSSKVWWDDLANAGSPTMDLGAFAVNGNITNTATAFNATLALSTASATAGVPFLADFANAGKRAWEFASGQTTDPGGIIQVKGTINTAALDLGGTITVEIAYRLD